MTSNAVPQKDDIWKYENGSDIDVYKVISVGRPSPLDIKIGTTVEDYYELFVTSEDGTKAYLPKIVPIKEIQIGFWKLIDRPGVDSPRQREPNPGIINPIHYPDAPETEEELERAFAILRNLCRG